MPPPICDGINKPKIEDCCVTCMKATCAPCETSWENTTTCADGVEPESKDDGSCCRTCKPDYKKKFPDFKPRKEDKSRDKSEKKHDVKKEDFKKCLEEAGVCADGERPARTSERSPCKSCTRPSRKCNIQDFLTKWFAESRPCDATADEKPVTIEGSCVKSCQPDKPVCSPACSAENICVPSRNQTGTSLCKPKKKRKMKLRLGSFLRDQNLTKEKVREILSETVERFCDNTDPETVEKCSRMQEFIESLECTNVEDEGDGIFEVNIEMEETDEEPENQTRRRLTDAQDLLDAALDDSEATGDILCNFANPDCVEAKGGDGAGGDDASSAAMAGSSFSIVATMAAMWM